MHGQLKLKTRNKKKTARLAKTAMTKLSKGKPLGPEEQDALDLVQSEMDQAVFGDQLKRSRTGGKTKNGYKVDQEMTDYVAHRFLMMCGSDGECLRVGRELGDRRQTCRSNNNDAADIQQPSLHPVSIHCTMQATVVCVW